MTTGLAGSLLCGYKPLVLARLKFHEIFVIRKYALPPKIRLFIIVYLGSL